MMPHTTSHPIDRARKCANGVAYHSVPLWPEASRGGGGGPAGEEGGGLEHLRDMLQEVQLLHLHPTAAFSPSSSSCAASASPDCLLYQVPRPAPPCPALDYALLGLTAQQFIVNYCT